MKLFQIFFLVLLLSSCGEGDDKSIDVVDASASATNNQTVIERRANEDIVYEETQKYLDSRDLVEGINRRGDKLFITTTGVGDSKVASRCAAYSELGEYIIGVEYKKDASSMVTSSLKNSWLINNSVKFTFISETSVSTSSRDGVSGVSFNEEDFKSDVKINFDNDFGELALICRLESTTINNTTTEKEYYKYTDLRPKKINSMDVGFFNENDYIESYFSYMSDSGFKEVVFESGDTVGIALQVQINKK